MSAKRKLSFTSDIIVVDEGIPAPQGRGRIRQLLPLDQMKLGSSFFVPEHVASTGSVTSAAHNYGERNGQTYTIRRRMERGVAGTRVWRIK